MTLQAEWYKDYGLEAYHALHLQMKLQMLNYMLGTYGGT